MLMNRICVLCGSMEDWNLSDAAPVELLFIPVPEHPQGARGVGCIKQLFISEYPKYS